MKHEPIKPARSCVLAGIASALLLAPVQGSAQDALEMQVTSVVTATPRSMPGQMCCRNSSMNCWRAART